MSSQDRGRRYREQRRVRTPESREQGYNHQCKIQIPRSQFSNLLIGWEGICSLCSSDSSQNDWRTRSRSYNQRKSQVYEDYSSRNPRQYDQRSEREYLKDDQRGYDKYEQDTRSRENNRNNERRETVRYKYQQPSTQNYEKSIPPPPHSFSQNNRSSHNQERERKKEYQTELKQSFTDFNSFRYREGDSPNRYCERRESPRKQRFDNSGDFKRDYYPARKQFQSNRHDSSPSYKKQQNGRREQEYRDDSNHKTEYPRHEGQEHYKPYLNEKIIKSQRYDRYSRERQPQSQETFSLRNKEDIHKREYSPYTLFWRFLRRRKQFDERRDIFSEKRYRRDQSQERRKNSQGIQNHHYESNKSEKQYWHERKEPSEITQRERRSREARMQPRDGRILPREGRILPREGRIQPREARMPPRRFNYQIENTGMRGEHQKNSSQEFERKKKIIKIIKKKTPSNSSQNDSSQNDSFQSESKDRSKDAKHYVYTKGELFDNGRFQLIKRISDGTFGRVFEVADLSRGKKLNAMKVIRAVKRYVEAAEQEAEIIYKIQAKDLEGKFRIVKLLSTFKHGENYCMVFEKLGLSLYELLKKNDYKGYNIKLVQSFFKQILQSIGFLHSIRLTHTDLKPENILLSSSELTSTHLPAAENNMKNKEEVTTISKNTKFSDKIKTKKGTNKQKKPSVSSSSNSDSSNSFSSSSSKQSSSSSSSQASSKNVEYWTPVSDEIKIIDFGGATFADEHHSGIINTRQYRAPEVILGCCKWNELSDVWSIGCIIMELYSGSLFFPTHDNYEHLAMIEKVSGSIPRWMASETSEEKLKEHFKISDEQYAKYHSYFDWPKSAQNKSVQSVNKLENIYQTLKSEHYLLGDLVQKCLTVDPNHRITCFDALKHKFFQTKYD